MSVPVDKVGIARNTAWAFVTGALGVLVPLLLTPYVVLRVGLDGFGVWIFLNALAVWFAQADFGMAGAIVRETARRRAGGDEPGLRRLWGTWLTYDLLAAAALFALAAVGLGLIPSGLADPARPRPILLLLIAQSLLVPLYRHLHATLSGLQRLDRSSRQVLFFLPCSVGGTFVVLEGGGGLLGLALNGFFWLALQIVALWGAVRAAGMPPPARGSGDDLGVLVRFGVRLHLSQLLAQFLRSDRLLLGVLGVPTEAIARYQFGAGVAERLGGVVGELTSAVPGAVADLDRRGDHGRVVQIFLRSLRINAVAGFFLFGFLACFSREILTVWLGSSYPSSAEVLRICTAGALAAVLGSPVLAVLAALGHPGRIALSYATGVAGAGVLYIAWGRRYDVRGLAACLSLGWILVQAAAASGLRRRLEVRWREVAGNALLRPWIVLLPSAVALGVVRALGVEAGVRGEALTVVLPAFLGAALLAWPLARFSGAIGKGDVEVIRSLGRRPTA